MISIQHVIDLLNLFGCPRGQICFLKNSIRYICQIWIIENNIHRFIFKIGEMRTQQSEQNFKVAPIISDEKFQAFRTKAIGTILGLATFGHYDNLTEENQRKTLVLEIIVYFLSPALIVVPNSVIVEDKLHPLAVLIPVVFNTILALLVDVILAKDKKFHKYVAAAVYSYIWAVHFWISRQLFYTDTIGGFDYAAIFILSLVTVLSSSNTIIFCPVRQFSGSTFDYQELNFHSTLYVRFYAAIPVLVTELAVLYSPEGTIYHPSLPVLQYVGSLLFVLWWFGWISSFYNNSMFIVNNLFNCLVFGEQLTHSGHNYRGNYSWWASFNLFFSNLVAIGLNVALIRTMFGQNQVTEKIVERQHVFLVFLASATSIITSVAMYFSFRCSNEKKSLIRFNKFDLSQKQEYQSEGSKKKVFKGRFFFGHKQVLMLLANILVPVAISLLLVFVFAAYYDGYGNGKQMQKQTNFIAEKLTTWVILAINVFCYLFFVIFKEITRTRSKVGCSINPCCFNQYHTQIERDLYMKLILKFTGALSIMVLVLRIQNITTFSNYIMSQTPLSPDAHPGVQFFIQSILVPILIYRSYKRSQTFSHFFHISIIVSLILTLLESTLYFYQSILVVLAFPNFPENPFRLLLLSPFTVPQKLVHKNQCLYRIGYILVNFVTLFLYIATLGTMEFTMVFGLPAYWCVIPTINCQMPKTLKLSNEFERQSINKLSDFEQTGQMFNPTTNNVNRSTPEHNLYEKIVSEIPFYIFRNKRPGYYLLRISKYIMLVEVVADFYGLFQIVNLIGLQTQEITTCHAKEGQTIDRIVDYNWGSNPSAIECWACNDALKTVIHEQHQVKKVKITGQNQIQLTGIIESTEFFELFKKCLIKSIIFYYGKMLRKNEKNSLTNEQMKQAEVLLDDLQGRISKDKIDEFFPHQFVTESGNKLGYSVRFKQLNTSKIMVKKKLPPINQGNKKQGKAKKQQIIDDFADLIGGASSNTGNFLSQNAVEQVPAEKLNIDTIADESVLKQNVIVEDNKKDASDLHMAVIVSAYLSIIGKINYINPERVSKIMKKDPSALSQFQFSGGLDLAAVSIGCALKIAIGKQLEGQTEVKFEDYTFYDKNEYMGTLQSAGFSESVEANKEDIWTVSYNQTKKILSVKRLARNETALYMFSFETNAVQAVWNNLRFQLLFATNDNDERYSIQTHPYLLRNLLVEACEEPYGYAGYYSEEFLNL